MNKYYRLLVVVVVVVFLCSSEIVGNFADQLEDNRINLVEAFSK